MLALTHAAGNAFYNPATAPQGRRRGSPPSPAGQSRHVATGGAAAAGVASPLAPEPGIAGQVGSANLLPRGALGHIPPVRGGVRCLRLAGLCVPPGRAAFPALKRFPR